MSLDIALPTFFSVILAGESKTYNDHNYYKTGNKLISYIEGSYGQRYSLLSKPLSEYTVGEVINFQSHSRDNVGQLWATGRYQIIPDTLKSIVKSAGISYNDKYDKKTQDKLGLELLKIRSAVKNYIYGNVEDNQNNLDEAVKNIAMTWSSVGVPYPMKGKYGNVEKGQSYYSGGGDKASVNPDIVANGLKKLRAVITGVGDVGDFIKKKTKPITIIIIITSSIALGLLSYIIYKNSYGKDR